jgi:hypothetical protein
VEGLASIYQSCVRSFISAYDFVVLTETFSTDFPSHLFPLFDVFISPGVKLSDSVTARLSGGVVILIKKQCATIVKRIHVEIDNCVAFKLPKELTGLSTNCVLIGLYLPPYQSIYYSETEIDNGVYLLEHCIIDIFEEHGELPIILCGDLNARTSDANAKDVSLPDSFRDNEDNENISDEQYQRTSKDCIKNEFGRYLLNVCEQFKLVILNGLLRGDQNGNFTYVAHNGSSVIDYFVMSRSLVQFGLRLKVMPRIESKHMPVEMEFKVSRTQTSSEKNLTMSKVHKYVWKQENAVEYQAVLMSRDVSLLFEQGAELIDVNIEAALGKFYEGITTAGQCMLKTFTQGKIKDNPWFDSECRETRSMLRKALRKYIKASNDVQAKDLRTTYTEERKHYKLLIKQKKSDHKKNILRTLEESGKDSNKFWSTIKFATANVQPQNYFS